ncbi:MAG: DUF4349 domain-containing protein [Bacillota bacterium]|nr:DUF4349 domain-containing protein [Bacillota bacterium]
MNKKIRFSFITLALILALSIPLSGCGAKTASKSSNSAPSTSENGSLAAQDRAEANTAEKATETADKQKETNSSKIIKTADIDLQTKNYTKAIDSILNTVKTKGGYIQSSKSNGNTDDNSRGAYYVIRMPKDYFDEFLSNVGNLGKITSSSTQGENISSQYYDTEAHLKALKVQEDRLLELLKKSGSLKDILEIENQLSNVRYQIESLTSSLKNWDNQVDYATININVHEVSELTTKPVSLGEKIKKTFNDSLKSLGSLFKAILLVMVAIVPYLIIIIPVSIVVYILMKKRKKKE